MPNRTQEQAEASRKKDLAIIKQAACYPRLRIKGSLTGRNKRRFVADMERHDLRMCDMINVVFDYYYDNHPQNPTR